MTQVRFSETIQDGKIKFSIYSCGHCGLMEHGVDIGCRVSSALISALISAVNLYDFEKQIRVGEGVAQVDITLGENDAGVNELAGAFLVVRRGFEALESVYPDYFMYSERIVNYSCDNAS